MMISLQALQDTLKLNNKAVAMYQSNDISEADKTYQESLCLVQEWLKCPHENTNHVPAPTLPQHECYHTSTQTSSDIPIQEELFVYQGALVFQESPSSPRAQQVQAMKIYCAGILLNTAILHHQHSSKTGTSASMDRAEQLYQSSLQLVAGLSTFNDTVILVAVAASNNLAQIEFDKAQTMQANGRLRLVKQLLHSTGQAAGRIFTGDELQGMLSNTLLINSIAA